MNLDRDWLPTCTADARRAATNVPEPYRALTLQGHPDAAASAKVSAWVADVVGGSERRGLVLFGPAGSGKTGLACCAAAALAGAGVGSRFQWNVVTSPAYVESMRHDDVDVDGELSPVWFERFSNVLAMGRGRGASLGTLELWVEAVHDVVSALVLDDVAVEAGTPFRESTLLRLVEWAFDRNRRLVLTLNASPVEWAATVGERVADRLLDASQFLTAGLSGRSLR